MNTTTREPSTPITDCDDQKRDKDDDTFAALELERQQQHDEQVSSIAPDAVLLCGCLMPCKGRTRFVLLCAGAIGSAMGFAALQEGVWRMHGFTFSGFFTLWTTVTMAACGQLERVCTRDTVRVGPLKSYFKLSILTLSGMWFTNWSLQFLNYPTRVLFKGAKLVPTMAMGTLMQVRCAAPRVPSECRPSAVRVPTMALRSAAAHTPTGAASALRRCRARARC